MTPKQLPPFLKWVGGKYRARGWLSDILVEEVARRPRYVEPFVGSGAIVLELLRRGALNGKVVNLYDGCRGLIDTWDIVTAKDPSDVNTVLKLASDWVRSIKDAPSEEEAEHRYYTVRETTSPQVMKTKQVSAATFLTLNWCCFNGEHRENREGMFNTPIGRNAKKSARDYAKDRSEYVWAVRNFFRMAAKRLQVEFAFKCMTHTDAYRREIQNGQLEHTTYYADPPYMSNTESVQYIKEGFVMQDHIELRDFSKQVWASGGAIFQTNADVGDMRRLYRHFEILNTVEDESLAAKGVRGARERLLVKGLKP